MINSFSYVYGIHINSLVCPTQPTNPKNLYRLSNTTKLQNLIIFGLIQPTNQTISNSGESEV